MLTLLGTLLGGGITGILGNLITQIINMLNQRQVNQHDLALLKAKTESAIALANVKTEGAVKLEEMTAFTESIKAMMVQPKLLPEATIDKLLSHWWGVGTGIILSIFFGIVDIIKAMIRPGMAVYLGVMATYITVMSYNTLKDTLGVDGQILTPENAMVLLEVVVYTVLYMFTVVWGWYFADRRTAKFLKELMKKSNLI